MDSDSRFRSLVSGARWAGAGLVATCGLLLVAPALAQPASQKNEGLGPAGQAALERLMARPRGHIGLQMINLTDGLRDYFGVAEGTGVLVAGVTADGPADRAGLKAGDVIVRVDEDAVMSSQQLADLIGGQTSGAVLMRYIRRGDEATASVAVEQREAIVVKLSPTIVRHRVESRGAGGIEQVVTVEHRSDGGEGVKELDLVLDELNVFFSGDGMRRKLDRIEQLDLQEMEKRIRLLEAELVRLEERSEQASAGQPPN